MSFFQWLQESFPPAPKWRPEDAPDLTGKVVIVTGGNAGIGREITKGLLKKNAKVYIATRSEDRAREAIDVLTTETGKKAAFHQLDLSDLAQVRESAQAFAKRESHIDLLYLNAGVMLPPIDALTKQGYDLTVGISLIGHHLFLRLLYPLLLAAPAPDPARIIWVASFAHHHVPGGRLNYATFTDGPERRKTGLFLLYDEAKLAQVTLSVYLANRAKERGERVVSIALHPGNINTEIFRDKKSWLLKLWVRVYPWPTPYGAITPLYAGTAPEAVEHKYLRPWARPGSPNLIALDVTEQDKLWNWLEEQVKDYL
ncbi:NAD(P)-binding protein [Lentinus tigrinus ALCF2SS1-7]|uniref:NAD(P)-binding protein n=1 Tax=Lentinus tigrinus ALCF2SS1-6 TaxID=1328759 RepID=A0A5C2RRB3_9APHY|nr:NAD(P)-binding protein [Lentinus tigrinus ALCF2SS1-6]RPD73820.1 NAD(P)-binding protein [Lentinus tigrinus ALCF2SS1-7]